MDADPACSHPVDPDAAVGGMHHFNGNITLYISACTGVGFHSLGGEVGFRLFRHGLRLGTHQAVY